MHRIAITSLLSLTIAFFVLPGCKKSEQPSTTPSSTDTAKTTPPTSDTPPAAAIDAPAKPTITPPPTPPTDTPATAAAPRTVLPDGSVQLVQDGRTVTWPPRPAISMENNPTVTGGRGTPVIDSRTAPVAWMYVDGQEGEFRKSPNGDELMQWYIKGTTSPRPSFRLEALTDVVGDPDSINCIIQSNVEVMPENTADIYVIGIRTDSPVFLAGEIYWLGQLSADFTVTDVKTRAELPTFPELPDGEYGMVCKVANTKENKEAHAISYFTVKRDGGK